MQRDIRPTWLIRLAEELGGVGATQGQPRNTDLRRSVSTAYYALFHRVALGTARAVLPNGTAEEVFGLARHITHKAIKQVAAYIAGDMPPRHLGTVIDRLRLNADLSSVATTFIEMQEQREDADYNHLADFTRPGVLALVARSHAAIDLLDQNSASADFGAFFGLIALRTSIS